MNQREHVCIIICIIGDKLMLMLGSGGRLPWMQNLDRGGS